MSNYERELNTYEREIKNRLIKQIGKNLLVYSKLLQQDTRETFVPPTEEEIFVEYYHNALFNRTVDSIVVGILHEVINMGGKNE